MQPSSSCMYDTGMALAHGWWLLNCWDDLEHAWLSSLHLAYSGPPSLLWFSAIVISPDCSIDCMLFLLKDSSMLNDKLLSDCIVVVGDWEPEEMKRAFFGGLLLICLPVGTASAVAVISFGIPSSGSSSSMIGPPVGKWNEKGLRFLTLLRTDS